LGRPEIKRIRRQGRRLERSSSGASCRTCRKGNSTKTAKLAKDNQINFLSERGTRNAGKSLTREGREVSRRKYAKEDEMEKPREGTGPSASRRTMCADDDTKRKERRKGYEGL